MRFSKNKKFFITLKKKVYQAKKHYKDIIILKVIKDSLKFNKIYPIISKFAKKLIRK